jgi:cyclic pyranopterin phosphate synthase
VAKRKAAPKRRVKARVKAKAKPRPKAKSKTNKKKTSAKTRVKRTKPQATPKAAPKATLSHIDQRGQAHMVDVSAKFATERVAVAEGRVIMLAQTLDAVIAGNAPKGDVLGAARLAGIMAAKRTHGLIPLCHPLPITKVEIEITPDGALPGFSVRATVKVNGQTGVEMEALVAVSISCLTIYDMAKAIEKSMHIEGIRLISKSGGKSGDFKAEI